MDRDTRRAAARAPAPAYAASGDVASALAAYENCRGTLREALGVAPSPATRARHEALLAQAG